MKEADNSQEIDRLIDKLKIKKGRKGLTFILDKSSISLEGLSNNDLTYALKLQIVGHLISLNAVRQSVESQSSRKDTVVYPIQRESSKLGIQNEILEIPVLRPDWLNLDNTKIRLFIKDLSQKAKLTLNQTVVLELYSRLNEFQKAAQTIGRGPINESNKELKTACVQAMERLIYAPAGPVEVFNYIITNSAFLDEEKELLQDRLYKDHLSAQASLQDDNDNSTRNVSLVLTHFYSSFNPNIVRDLIKSRWFKNNLSQVKNKNWLELQEKYDWEFLSQHSSISDNVYRFIKKEYDSYEYPRPENFPSGIKKTFSSSKT